MTVKTCEECDGIGEVECDQCDGDVSCVHCEEGMICCDECDGAGAVTT